MEPQNKREFQEDYWETVKEKFAVSNKPLIHYDSINYELKNIKNAIGREILVHVTHTKSDIIECDEKLNIGEQQVNQLYSRIEGILDKQLDLYRMECQFLKKKIRDMIKESIKGKNVTEFFDTEIWNLDQIEEFIEHFEVNMYASYHLMKKLDRETQQLNLNILDSFLEREAKDPKSSYIYLARASRVGALLEGYRLKIQLLELNKDLIIKKVGSKDETQERKIFNTKMKEMKEEFIKMEKLYKQHRNLWLRCSTKLNEVTLYDDLLDKESDDLRNQIKEIWKEIFGEGKVTFPKKEEEEKEKKKSHAESASYNDYSAWLVIVHTMIYMLIYYGNAPTAPSYSKALDFPESLTGVVQAATPIAAFISTFHYSAVISTSYKGGYAVSFFTMILGCLLYYIAKTFNSVPVIIIGRIILGYSGARVITRNFVGTKIKLKYRSVWSSYLVAFTAMSTTIGPGISSLLEFFPESTILGTDFRSYNAFTFFFFIICILFCIFFYVTFTDMPGSPSNNKLSKLKEQKIKGAPVKQSEREELKKGEAVEVGSTFTKKSLKSFHYSEIDFLENKQDEKNIADPTFKGLKVLRHTQIVKRYFPVYFVLVVFTITKMIQESIIAEIPLTVKLFYGYNSQSAGFLFLAFTPLTITASLLPGYLAQVKNFKNRNMMLFFTICLFICLLLKINLKYDEAPNKWYYIIVTCLTLSFTLAAEVSMTAMFGQITPYYIVQSFCNAGLLSGLGDTSGRAIGNSAVSLFNSIDGIKALTFYMYIAWAAFVLILLIITFVKLDSLRIIWKVKVDSKRFDKEIELEGGRKGEVAEIGDDKL